MSELPTLDGAKDAIQAKAKTLVPWLPNPFECPECGVYTDAERCYDPQRAAFYSMGMAPCWECPECGRQFQRDRK
jgi:transcription elongation factor Elf1